MKISVLISDANVSSPGTFVKLPCLEVAFLENRVLVRFWPFLTRHLQTRPMVSNICFCASTLSWHLVKISWSYVQWSPISWGRWFPPPMPFSCHKEQMPLPRYTIKSYTKVIYIFSLFWSLLILVMRKALYSSCNREWRFFGIGVWY